MLFLTHLADFSYLERGVHEVLILGWAIYRISTTDGWGGFNWRALRTFQVRHKTQTGKRNTRREKKQRRSSTHQGAAATETELRRVVFGLTHRCLFLRAFVFLCVVCVPFS